MMTSVSRGCASDEAEVGRQGKARRQTNKQFGSRESRLSLCRQIRNQSIDSFRVPSTRATYISIAIPRRIALFFFSSNQIDLFEAGKGKGVST